MFLGGALLFTMILAGCPSKWPPLLGGPPSPAKYSAEEIRGRVVDEETEQPLSGVTVAVTWDLRGGFHGGHIKWLNLADTVTDAKGEFYFPAWGPIRRPHGTTLHGDQPWLTVFAPRYYPSRLTNERGSYTDSLRRWYGSGKDVTMVPFRGSDKEYAKQIETLAADQYAQFFSFGTCDWEKLPRFLGAIYREAEGLRRKGILEAPELNGFWGAAARKHSCHALSNVFGDMS